MKVVMLLGPSSAGKSTLCKELVASHGWKSLSIDEIGIQVIQECTSNCKSQIIAELNKNGLINKLETLMSEDEIINLSGTGILTISKGNHKITDYQFANSNLDKLEELMIKNGFNQDEISEIAIALRLTANIGEKIITNYLTQNITENSLFELLYDQAFQADNLNDNVILDIVPTTEFKLNEFIENFKKRGEQFASQHKEQNIEVLVVLAYCPVEKLSERIKQRNLNAINENNPVDQRIGLFPFEQLSKLVTVTKENNDVAHEHVLSKNELFAVVDNHYIEEDKKSAIFIENPSDVQNSQSEVDETFNFTASDAGYIKFELENDEKQTPILDKVRIGSKSVIKEFNDLSIKFGLFDNINRFAQDSTFMTIRNKEFYNAIINTSIGSPSDLAQEMLNQLEFDKNKLNLTF